MRPSLIDVGHITAQVAQLPGVPPLEEPTDDSQGSSVLPGGPPKLNGNGNHPPADVHLSVAERLAQNRQRRQRGQLQQGSHQGQQQQDRQQQDAHGQQGATQGQSQGQEAMATGTLVGATVVPLIFTLDLVHELTHNQRQYRPDKETGGVNVSILHLPDIIDTAIERIQTRIPIRCGRAPIATACIEWGLKGLGQYTAVQRLLYLKSVFKLREETGASSELEAGLSRGRNGRSLYGVRGQILHQVFKSFKMGFTGDVRENIYLPLDTYTDLKEITHYGLGLELQDGAVLTMMYTLVDVGSCEATRDVTVEEDRLEMKAILDRFLDHAQARSEAAEMMMRGWGMLEGETK